MKYSYVSFFIFLITILVAYQSTNATHCALQHITAESVNKKQEAIEWMLYRHRCVKACILTGVTVTSCFYIFDWIKKYVWDEQHACINAPSETELTTISLYSAAQHFAYNFLYMVGRYAMLSYMINYAFHPNTLKWYTKKHIPYKKTVALIQEYALLLKTSLESPSDEIDYYMDTLTELMQELLTHVECMCAYLQYQAVEEHHDVQQHYNAIVTFLLKAAHDWATHMMFLSFDTAQACDTCIHETHAFAEIVKRELEHAYILYISNTID